MINALASVPFVIWGLEYSWSIGAVARRGSGRCRAGVSDFRGSSSGRDPHGGARRRLRALSSRHRAGLRAALRAIGMAVALAGLGILLSAVQWVPSKELLDRSPRAEGLSWEDLTYGRGTPSCCRRMVVREAYGTRARDTDWMDGFYPYHEMNTYLGLIAIVLAVVGAGAGRLATAGSRSGSCWSGSPWC